MWLLIVNGIKQCGFYQSTCTNADTHMASHVASAILLVTPLRSNITFLHYTNTNLEILNIL